MQKSTSRKSLRALSMLICLALALSFCIPVLASTTSKYIGLAKAKSIALEDAAQSEEAVRFVKAIRYQKGRYGHRYSLIFLSANSKHHYEIDAKTGDILASNQYDLHGSKSTKGNASYETDSGKTTVISQSKARDIALKHAKATAKNIRDFDIELKDKKTYPYYEVEFEYKGWDYEYEIDAIDGEILTWERDRS